MATTGALRRAARLRKELQDFSSQPPHGIQLWPAEEDGWDRLEATVDGPEGSPYAGRTFSLLLTVGERYPMEPPCITFSTPIYHPNVDTSGRICLDLLKMPPTGNWRPPLNLAILLTSVRLLMGAPNPDDPLCPQIAHEYRTNRELYWRKASAQQHENDSCGANMPPSSQV